MAAPLSFCPDLGRRSRLGPGPTENGPGSGSLPCLARDLHRRMPRSLQRSNAASSAPAARLHRWPMTRGALVSLPLEAESGFNPFVYVPAGDDFYFSPV